MTVQELAQACADAMQAGLRSVALALPGPAPRGERVRLDRATRRRCPMGEVMCWTEEHGTVARFAPGDVLAWMAARGLVSVESSIKEPTDDES